LKATITYKGKIRSTSISYLKQWLPEGSRMAYSKFSKDKIINQELYIYPSYLSKMKMK
jgi:hypothetical protein